MSAPSLLEQVGDPQYFTGFVNAVTRYDVDRNLFFWDHPEAIPAEWLPLYVPDSAWGRAVYPNLTGTYVTSASSDWTGGLAQHGVYHADTGAYGKNAFTAAGVEPDPEDEELLSNTKTPKKKSGGGWFLLLAAILLASRRR